MTQRELYHLCVQLDIALSIRKPRWRYLKDANVKLIRDALGYVKDGTLQKEELTREKVRNIARNRRRRERRKEIKTQQKLRDFYEAMSMLKRWRIL